eukprot:TRINITY_DN8940_c0_g2_i1.p1 TRINITY_DN8940_c0_g2~~TRINITY_DN8940_c0_g2_i1.p1  ORF type:complete len:1539 (+),score=222.70 TRINITY_DN8940_c0_g2_i1:457-5073(+)
MITPALVVEDMRVPNPPAGGGRIGQADQWWPAFCATSDFASATSVYQDAFDLAGACGYRGGATRKFSTVSWSLLSDDVSNHSLDHVANCEVMSQSSRQSKEASATATNVNGTSHQGYRVTAEQSENPIPCVTERNVQHQGPGPSSDLSAPTPGRDLVSSSGVQVEKVGKGPGSLVSASGSLDDRDIGGGVRVTGLDVTNLHSELPRRGGEGRRRQGDDLTCDRNRAPPDVSKKGEVCYWQQQEEACGEWPSRKGGVSAATGEGRLQMGNDFMNLEGRSSEVEVGLGEGVRTFFVPPEQEVKRPERLFQRAIIETRGITEEGSEEPRKGVAEGAKESLAFGMQRVRFELGAPLDFPTPLPPTPADRLATHLAIGDNADQSESRGVVASTDVALSSDVARSSDVVQDLEAKGKEGVSGFRVEITDFEVSVCGDQVAPAFISANGSGDSNFRHLKKGSAAALGGVWKEPEDEDEGEERGATSGSDKGVSGLDRETHGLTFFKDPQLALPGRASSLSAAMAFKAPQAVALAQAVTQSQAQMPQQSSAASAWASALGLDTPVGMVQTWEGIPQSPSIEGRTFSSTSGRESLLKDTWDLQGGRVGVTLCTDEEGEGGKEEQWVRQQAVAQALVRRAQMAALQKRTAGKKQKSKKRKRDREDRQVQEKGTGPQEAAAFGKECRAGGQVANHERTQNEKKSLGSHVNGEERKADGGQGAPNSLSSLLAKGRARIRDTATRADGNQPKEKKNHGDSYNVMLKGNGSSQEALHLIGDQDALTVAAVSPSGRSSTHLGRGGPAAAPKPDVAVQGLHSSTSPKACYGIVTKVGSTTAPKVTSRLSELIDDEVGDWEGEDGEGEEGVKKRKALTPEQAEARKKAQKRKKQQKRRAEGTLNGNGMRAAEKKTPREPQVCKYWAEGRCAKGDDCSFAHTGTPATKSIICRYHLQNTCLRGEDCEFSHTLSSFPCKYFHVLKKCLDGETCRFSHASISSEAHGALTKAFEEERQKKRQLALSFPGASDQPHRSKQLQLPGSLPGVAEGQGDRDYFPHMPWISPAAHSCPLPASEIGMIGRLRGPLAGVQLSDSPGAQRFPDSLSQQYCSDNLQAEPLNGSASAQAQGIHRTPWASFPSSEEPPPPPSPCPLPRTSGAVAICATATGRGAPPFVNEGSWRDQVAGWALRSPFSDRSEHSSLPLSLSLRGTSDGSLIHSSAVAAQVPLQPSSASQGVTLHSDQRKGGHSVQSFANHIVQSAPTGGLGDDQSGADPSRLRLVEQTGGPPTIAFRKVGAGSAETGAGHALTVPTPSKGRETVAEQTKAFPTISPLQVMPEIALSNSSTREGNPAHASTLGPTERPPQKSACHFFSPPYPLCTQSSQIGTGSEQKGDEGASSEQGRGNGGRGEGQAEAGKSRPSLAALTEPLIGSPQSDEGQRDRGGLAQLRRLMMGRTLGANGRGGDGARGEEQTQQIRETWKAPSPHLPGPRLGYQVAELSRRSVGAGAGRSLAGEGDSSAIVGSLLSQALAEGKVRQNGPRRMSQAKGGQQMCLVR